MQSETARDTYQNATEQTTLQNQVKRQSQDKRPKTRNLSMQITKTK